jgi:hypothetical protein
MITHYIYLIQEREFIKTCEKIYKIGRTKQENSKRINHYPKQSILLLQIICDNCDQLEREIIKIFKHKYNRRKDIGNEYFEGDCEDMMKTIYYTRNNIIDIVNQEKIERDKMNEEKEILRKLKELKQEEKGEIKRMQKGEIKQTQKGEIVKKTDSQKKNYEIKTIVDWMSYKVKNNTLKDDTVRNLYLSYSEYTKENNYVPISETQFGILLNNNNKYILFNIGYKKKTKGGMLMTFNIPIINKELNVI